MWGPYASALMAEGFAKPKGGVDVGDHPPITPVRAASEGEIGGKAKEGGRGRAGISSSNMQVRGWAKGTGSGRGGSPLHHTCEGGIRGGDRRWVGGEAGWGEGRVRGGQGMRWRGEGQMVIQVSYTYLKYVCEGQEGVGQVVGKGVGQAGEVRRAAEGDAKPKGGEGRGGPPSHHTCEGSARGGNRR